MVTAAFRPSACAGRSRRAAAAALRSAARRRAGGAFAVGADVGPRVCRSSRRLRQLLFVANLARLGDRGRHRRRAGQHQHGRPFRSVVSEPRAKRGNQPPRRVLEALRRGTYTIPPVAVLALVNSTGWWDDSPWLQPIGEWGDRCARAYMVGAPPMLAMQEILGSGRPYNGYDQSHWKPFAHDNGVSGHAFMSSVLFISAADMMPNQPICQGVLYACSFMTAWARINDNMHFLSQAAPGLVDGLSGLSRRRQHGIGPSPNHDSARDRPANDRRRADDPAVAGRTPFGRHRPLGSQRHRAICGGSPRTAKAATHPAAGSRHAICHCRASPASPEIDNNRGGWRGSSETLT